MLFSEPESITQGKLIRFADDQQINLLLTDSRKVTFSEGTVFFAIKGKHHDAHQFLRNLYQQGIRCFVIEQAVEDIGENANVLFVPSAIHALQQIVATHRTSIKTPVIGITGSNGKTIVKEWLYQLLSPEFKIAKNPASYNSQLGVPLSVWQLQPHHTLGIFEAGISTINEMDNLRKVMQPTIGIFTNIGSAHNEGFASIEEKVSEKMKLFTETGLLIYCKDHELIDAAVKASGTRGYSWGSDEHADVRISKHDNTYRIHASGTEFTIHLPFSDAASVENCFHCLVTLLHFGYTPQQIQQRLGTLRAVPMRLELKEGINRCQIIDDTYNNDLAGLQVSVDFLSQQHLRKEKRLILSDIHESGLPDSVLVKRISSIVKSANVQNFVGIGPVLYAFKQEFDAKSQFYKSTEEFLQNFNFGSLHDEVILVKGARVFAFEKVVNQLQRKVHGTVMEIDLGALVHNLNYFKSCLKPNTKVMAMVKAFAYGSGSNEIANLLQYHKVDYLGVAYADEGVELRKNNINLPVMVMNPAEESFETILRHKLEPEIYSFQVLQKLSDFLQDRPCHVHLKLDTGMHRLGFSYDKIEALITLLLERPNMKVASIFSHLAAADEEGHDEFTRRQGKSFREMADLISQRLGYRPLYHILNSSGILRFADLQFDMVRLGIGLYGIDPTGGGAGGLKPVATLKTIISQIKHIAKGESVGYGRKGHAEKPLTTATIAIGYADGFSRAFSRGVGKVVINGKLAPVIGNVCMDMTMVDITDIPAIEGDEVIIFGKEQPIQQLADSIGTIPYEILTSTSERVKRIFVAESI
jgi:alanine racemase